MPRIPRPLSTFLALALFVCLPALASGPLTGDFNGDGILGCLDVDLLTAEIAAGTNDPSFDVNGDGSVNPQDLDDWLIIAASHNGFASSYLDGDANLDGAVDATDFTIWFQNRFTSTTRWCGGDFNTDGVVDGLDFAIWNQHKFTSIGAAR